MATRHLQIPNKQLFAMISLDEIPLVSEARNIPMQQPVPSIASRDFGFGMEKMILVQGSG
jgi:hypothetical protein